MLIRRSARAAVAIALSLPGAALAAEPLLVFDWQAPVGCPSREAVLARARELLGRPADSALTARLELGARVFEPVAGAWRLELRSRAGEGEPSLREVSAASCAELSDAAALLLALAIDPALDPARLQATVPSFEPEPAREPPPATAPVPAQSASAPSAVERGFAPAPEIAAVPSAQPSAPLRVGAEAALLSWTRRLPGTAFGVAAGARLSRAGFWGSASIGFFPSRHESVAGGTAGGDLYLLSAGPALGYAFELGRFVASPVAAFEWQGVFGSGTGVAHPSDASLSLLSFGAGARLGVRLSPGWSLFGESLFSAVATRPRFVLEGVGQVYRPEPWGFRFSLGAEWRKP